MNTFPTKILLATDGSKDADLAATIAVVLGRATDSELHVVTVAEEYPSYDAYRSLAERSRRLAQETLDKQVEKIEKFGGTVKEAHLLFGRADREVVKLAEEDVGAGLVVVGSRGLGRLRRALIGSVSMSVVHHAPCSVLVVRGPRRREEGGYALGKVLIAYDGSEEASAAAKVAAEIADATGSELHLLLVVASEPYPQPFEYVSYEEAEVWEAWEANLKRDEEQARSLVEWQARRMEAEGVKGAQAHLSFGRPDEEIVRLAEELDAGLVVVGNRGRGGIRRALLGSVSDSVVRHAHCPIMVVRSAEVSPE